MGTSGSVMVSHALGRLTSRIARRVTFFRLDFAPSVATSLGDGGLASVFVSMEGLCIGVNAKTRNRGRLGWKEWYQMVATPYWRLVNTSHGHRLVSRSERERVEIVYHQIETHYHDCRTS